MEINLETLYRALARDLAVDTSTNNYVQRRLHNEGSYFVTVTLPAFSKHVLLCIEQGYWSYFGSSIQCRRGLPVIFRGYLLSLFSWSDANNRYDYRSDSDPVALYVIRQFCEYSYKLNLEFEESVKTTFIAKFRSSDDDVPTYGDYEGIFVDAMRRNFETYYPLTFRTTLCDVASAAVPGTGTYSGCSPKTFWMTNSQERTVPPSAKDLRHGVRFNKRAPNPKIAESSQVSEVLFVPKDSRGPRVIVREPYQKLVMQLGFNRIVSRRLEEDTHYRINFESQETNRQLAHLSSITRSYATIDLKDASDSVSYAITRHIFRYSPLLKSFDRFRTPTAVLPDGSSKALKKVAGMGSGFTFPTMALIIHLAICTHVSVVLKIPYPHVSRHVYVYGDDIIVPTDWFDIAICGLLKVSLKPNNSKCYSRSDFRESCGGDYLHGNDVAPIRLKLAGSKLDTRGSNLIVGDPSFGFLQIERHCRELIKSLHYHTAHYLYKVVESKFGELPLVSGDSPYLGWYVNDSSLVDLTYGQSRSGSYSKKRVWAAKPIRGVVSDPCPYVYLRRSLTKVRTGFVLDICDPSEFGTTFVPHKIDLVRENVPGICLT